MTILTGLDLPLDSPGGSVELLRDLYLAPGRAIDADAFMLAPMTGSIAGEPNGPVILEAAGKQLDGPGFWDYVKNLTFAIERRFSPDDYDIVHLQHLAFGATPALLRAFPDHPRIALVHGTDLLFAADHPTQHEVLQEAASAADIIVVPTTAMASHLQRLATVASERIAHVPWGIPDHLLTAAPKRRADDHEELRLLYAGRLTAEKAAADLIESVAAIDDVVLSMAAPAAEYAELAKKTDLSSVNYLGWLTRAMLWERFADHDLLIVPSTRLEAFGLVAVEAQACGLPVLYQPVPGLVEVLGDSALAVQLNEYPKAVAAAVQHVRRNPSVLDELRDAGRSNASRFPLSRMLGELQTLSAQLAN